MSISQIFSLVLYGYNWISPTSCPAMSYISFSKQFNLKLTWTYKWVKKSIWESSVLHIKLKFLLCFYHNGLAENRQSSVLCFLVFHWWQVTIIWIHDARLALYTDNHAVESSLRLEDKEPLTNALVQIARASK